MSAHPLEADIPLHLVEVGFGPGAEELGILDVGSQKADTGYRCLFVLWAARSVQTAPSFTTTQVKIPLRGDRGVSSTFRSPLIPHSTWTSATSGRRNCTDTFSFVQTLSQNC